MHMHNFCHSNRLVRL